MKLGFVSSIMSDLPLSSILELAKEEGYDCVEVICKPQNKNKSKESESSYLDVTHFKKSEVPQLLKVCEEAKVSISALGFYQNVLSANKDEAKQAVSYLKKVIKTAKLLGVHQVNTFVGNDPELSVKQNMSRFLKIWPGIMKVAEKHQVRIGIDNSPVLISEKAWPAYQNMAFSPAIWRQMFNLIPSPYFGLNYDPSHLVWQQMDYLRPIREFSDRIFHLHVKDIRLDRYALDDLGILAYPVSYFTSKLPGLGDIEWSKLITALSDTGYDGCICVEVKDPMFLKTRKTRRAALWQSATFLRQFVPKED